MKTALATFVAGMVLFTQVGLSQVNQRKKKTKRPELPQPTKVTVYKTVGDVQLKMHIFNPSDHRTTDRRAAIVFFFGGGWRSGSPQQFFQHCHYLATRGMVAMAAEYRVYSRHQAQVIDCVADAKSAIRWVRTHADSLGIDPNRIASSGGSAGGHLGGAVGTLDGFDTQGEDLSVSARPNAMVLFNPAVDLTYEGFHADPQSRKHSEMVARMGAQPKELSPTYHITQKTPPAIILHGKADTTVPFDQSEKFAAKMKQFGIRCELAGYEGESHGFFNYGRSENKAFRSTLTRADQFLTSLGFLKGPPTVSDLFPTTK